MTTSSNRADSAAVNDWVTTLQEAYPDVPHPLDLETEKDCLQRLSRWREEVDELRSKYSEMDEEDFPSWIQRWRGGKQVIPCLLSIGGMNLDERKAWHELFVALSPKLADTALSYWQAHSRDSESSLSLEDLLGQLPSIFLVILSSFEPDRAHSANHDGGFASAEDRVRLVTWVHMASRYHINTYLQQSAYSVKPGSGHRHRLFQKVREAERTFLTKEGRMPTDREAANMIEGNLAASDAKEEAGSQNDSSYRLPQPTGETKSSTSMTKQVDEVRQHRAPVSLESSVTNTAESGSSEALTWAETLSGEQTGSFAEIETFFDPTRIVRRRTADNHHLSSAARKLLSSGASSLSPPEKFALGL